MRNARQAADSMGTRPRGIPRARMVMCMVIWFVMAALPWTTLPHYTSKPHLFVK
jgi:hypothetical protein